MTRLNIYTKQLMLLLLCFTIAISAIGCSSSRNYKRSITQLIEQENAVLLSDITEHDFSTSLALEQIEEVYELDACVNFYCGGYGLSVSSHEYGFYYSFDDQPLGVWGDLLFAASNGLTPEGDGFSGDFQHNYYYTEQVCEHFWYYELHF